ncbi:hypothetical protein BRADI_2g44843v3 [Brachypodium distachyon]|uniref:DUF7597 domain-containing protein n=1 Tax=Brachypodium distachyon TaxID=15368 RepID=A0A0Q3J900_BRADI|nr:hypothetical protein BRADI_2g44843v3 [Brachypodium distachyon]
MAALDLLAMERRPSPCLPPLLSGRCKFRLTEVSVGNLLNVCLGEVPEDFRVQHLCDRTFRFSVTNKIIGFHISSLKSFTRSFFVVYFHLWGFGGPDYVKEFYSWRQEEQLLWESPKKSLSPVKAHKSYAQAVANGGSILTSANAIPIQRPSALHRLSFNATSSSLNPWSLTDEVDLADVGYSEEDIQQCKKDHLLQVDRLQKKPIDIGTVFKRLQFLAASPAPAPEKNRFESENGPRHYGGLNSGVIKPSAHSQGTVSQASFPRQIDGPRDDARPTCTRCLRTGHTSGRRFDIVELAGRPQHGRYHIRGQIERANEDVAIVTLNPPPHPDDPFAVTRGIISHFVGEHLHLRVEHLHRCSLGHAYIRMNSTADKDWLVQHSPMVHNGISFSVTEHNRGTNWRGFTYNQEVWLMLLGYHLDLWSAEHLANVVSEWGKMILWDRSLSNMNRIILKVKVANVTMIPYSILLSHGADFQGPVFILSSSLLGVIPPDEQDPPENGQYKKSKKLLNDSTTTKDKKTKKDKKPPRNGWFQGYLSCFA